MRIDDLNRIPAPPGTEKPGQSAPRQAVEKDGATGSDQVEVSRLGQSLAAPDAGRMEQLRLQVESGSYEVSAQTVANALIDAHLKE